MSTPYDEDVPITRDLFRSVLPTAFAIIAFALGFIGSVQCNVIKFTSTSGFDGEPVTVQFGFWSHESVDFYFATDESSGSTTGFMVTTCTGYDQDVDIDAKWKAAAAFSILPLIFGGIDFVWMCVAKCTVNHWFDCIAFLLAFFCQSLSILFLDSNACKNNSVIQSIEETPFRENVTFQETCSMSQGMRCIVAACCFSLGGFTLIAAARNERQVAGNNVWLLAYPISHVNMHETTKSPRSP